MAFFEQLAMGFMDIFHLYNLIAISLGVLVGITVGALPGLTATMSVAVITPVTFTLSPEIGIIVVCILGLMGVASGLFPAMRAASVSPVESLRYE